METKGYAHVGSGLTFRSMSSASEKSISSVRMPAGQSRLVRDWLIDDAVHRLVRMPWFICRSDVMPARRRGEAGEQARRRRGGAGAGPGHVPSERPRGRACARRALRRRALRTDHEEHVGVAELEHELRLVDEELRAGGGGEARWRESGLAGRAAEGAGGAAKGGAQGRRGTCISRSDTCRFRSSLQATSVDAYSAR